MTLTEEIKGNAILRINENTPKITKCLSLLSYDQIWHQHNTSSNSIGKMIIHLCGNMRQYILSSLGGMPDLRDRNAEFRSDQQMTPLELIELLTTTISESCALIEKLEEVAILKIRNVQGYQLSGVGNIIHAVEHYSYHTGQIVYLAKMLLDVDFKFYDDASLTVKNEE